MKKPSSPFNPIQFALKIAGFACIGLGVIGIFLPLLPTTPFLLLAAFLLARSSPRVHQWMLSHRILGPPIRDWQERGAIKPRAKIAAAVLIALTVGGSVASGKIPVAGAIGLTILALVLIVFIVTRPND